MENVLYDVRGPVVDEAARLEELGMKILKLNIGNVKHVQAVVPLKEGKARLIVRSDSVSYNFFVSESGNETHLGYGNSKYLSSEVSGGFTGVVLGLYAQGNNTAVFENLKIEY